LIRPEAVLVRVFQIKILWRFCSAKITFSAFTVFGKTNNTFKNWFYTIHFINPEVEALTLFELVKVIFFIKIVALISFQSNCV
jgi:hypothetical protein